MGKFVKICKVHDIPEGSGKSLQANGTAVAVFNVGGSFYAINDTCAHRGGPLGEGELEGKTVICPWHGWRYDVTTGANQVAPDLPQKTYEIKVEGDDLLVGL